MIYCPKCSLKIASSFIALVIASFLANIGLDNIMDTVAEVTTCVGTLKNGMVDEGVEIIYLKKQ